MLNYEHTLHLGLGCHILLFFCAIRWIWQIFVMYVTNAVYTWPSDASGLCAQQLITWKCIDWVVFQCCSVSGSTVLFVSHHKLHTASFSVCLWPWLCLLIFVLVVVCSAIIGRSTKDFKICLLKFIEFMPIVSVNSGVLRFVTPTSHHHTSMICLANCVTDCFSWHRNWCNYHTDINWAWLIVVVCMAFITSSCVPARCSPGSFLWMSDWLFPDILGEQLPEVWSEWAEAEVSWEANPASLQPVPAVSTPVMLCSSCAEAFTFSACETLTAAGLGCCI